MAFLPAIPGMYEIGSTSLVGRVAQPQVVGTAKLKKTGQPALHFEEIAFTVFYPTDASRHTWTRRLYALNWVTRPVSASLKGYVHFADLSRTLTWLLWPVIYIYASLLKIPVHRNASLLDPLKAQSYVDGGDARKPWPLVVFSHGLGGSPTVYSQLCCRIASMGRVVVALEHRDGTAHMYRTSRGAVRLYVRDDDITWGDVDDHSRDIDVESDPLPLRTGQLEFRRLEIYQVYQALKQLSSTKDASQSGLQVSGNAPVDLSSWTGDKIDTGSLGLIGHSFGGATVFSVLSNPPPEGFTSLPVASATVLDPWLEPFPSPGPSPVSGQVNLLVINSEGFTLWTEHFERVRELARLWEHRNKRVITLVGARHMSFSDVQLLPIPLIRQKSAYRIMDTLSLLANAYLQDRLDDVLEGDGIAHREMKIIPKEPPPAGRRGWDRKIVGDPGDIVVH